MRQAGFDRILVAGAAPRPDALLVAGQAAAATSRIGFMVAHRPGFIAPTLAARQFATFDQLSGGRAAVHIISGGSDDRAARAMATSCRMTSAMPASEEYSRC